MWRWMLAIALAALVGCKQESAPKAQQPAEGAAAPAAGKKLVVGFSQVGSESAWRLAETRSIRDEAAKRGAELRFDDAQGEQGAQLQAIASFVAQKVDVIILAPVVATGWEVALQQAKDAEIPVILVDRGINVVDESLYVTLIASDFVEEGRMAARWLAQKMNGKANIVELQGTTGSAPAMDRQKGFNEVLAKYPGMKVIKSQSADFTRAKGREVMESFIKSDRANIQAVFAHNDDMVLGAIEALEAAGMNPGRDVTLISIDAVKAAFEAMIAGKLNATVECNPLMGPLVFDTINKVRAGEKVPKFIQNQDRLFEAEQAAQLIKTRQY